MIRTSFILLIILVLAGCATTTQDIKVYQRKHDVEGLVNIIKTDPDKSMRVEAIRSLGYIRDPRAINGLRMALNSESWVERETAVKTLGKLRDHLVLEPLIFALGDDSDFVRDSAAKSLMEVATSLGKKKDPRVLKYLIGAIETAHHGHRESIIEAFQSAVEQLSRVHEPTFIHVLIDALQHDNKIVRIQAIEALGNFDDPRTVNPLLQSLKDPVGDVRDAAKLALKKVTDTRAATPLFVALKSNDPVVRDEAAQTLGKFKDPEIVNRVIRHLSDDDDNARAGAAKAMEYIIHPRAMKQLVSLLDDLNTDVRKAAGNALDKYHWRPRDDVEAAKYCVAKQNWSECGKFGKNAIQPLVSALKGNDPKIRRFASNELFKLKWTPKNNSEKALFCVAKQDWEECVTLGDNALNALIEELNNDDWRIKISVADTLAEINNPAAITPLIASLDDSNADVRTAIVEALGTFRNEKVVAALIKAMDDSNRGVRKTAANMLHASIQDYQTGKYPAVTTYLINALTDNNRGVRVEAARLLGKLKDPNATKPLIAALDDIDSDVRHEARVALNQMKDNRAISSLVAALDNNNTDVKSDVINVLSKYKDHRAIEPLLETIKDDNSKIRIKTIKALGQINDPRAVSPLVKSLDDYDPQVRRAAAIALSNFDDKRSVSALVSSLTDLDVLVRKESRKSLFKLNWTPLNEKEFALHCIAKKEWNVCESYGTHLVEPLILELKQDKSPDRVPAARLLGEIRDPRAVKPLIDAITSTQWLDDEFEKKNLLNSASNALVKYKFDAVPDLKRTLTSWYTAKYSASILAQIGWKPHTQEEEIHFLVAKRAENDLRAVWKDTKKVLMKDIQSKDINKMSNALYAFIGLGKDEIISDLLDVLEHYGTVQIAEAYLNSGHERLVNGAENWTAQRGLQVHQYSDGNSPVEWGRL